MPEEAGEADSSAEIPDSERSEDWGEKPRNVR